MENMNYFFELYDNIPRGGPGDNESTKKAFNSFPNPPSNSLILDIGCGPGEQTIELARIIDGKIIALDNHQPFLDKLIDNAKKETLQNKIETTNQSMLEINFKDETFDIIWSEGALYFLGFKNGLNKCNKLLKPQGYMAVTEAVYLLPDPPAPVIDFWKDEYPQIINISTNINIIKEERFDLLSHFTLPKSSWLNNFYNPMEIELEKLLSKYKDNSTATEIYTTIKEEINIYRKYSDYFGYEFFIMQKQ